MTTLIVDRFGFRSRPLGVCSQNELQEGQVQLKESNIMPYKKITDTSMEAVRVLFIDYSNYLCSTNATAAILI